MEYFAKFAAPYGEQEDRSYPSPDYQLLWRLDDLQDRYDALSRDGAPYRNGVCLSRDELRFALPTDLETVGEVEAAIRLAQEDLYTDYGIDVTASPAEDTVWETQLCLFAMPELLMAA